MKRPLLTITCITIALFWMTFFKGYVPFPGDFLLSEYSPWKNSSYFGYVAGSIPHKAQYFDVVRELYPWKTLVIQQLKTGQIPLWNPYNFSGAPLMANYQSQTWYPLSFVYFILPQPIAWSMLVIAQILLGMIFMYLFAHSIGLSQPAAVLAAILFNLSSFSTVWLEFNTVWHTILWIPFILYLFERRLKTPPRFFTLLFVFSLFSSITAGHPQDFINCLIFISIYIAARLLFLDSITIKEKFSIIFELSILGITSFFTAGVQILPTVALFQASSRVPHDVPFIINNMLIQLWQLPIAIISDFFGNPATRTYTLPDTYINKSLSIGTVGFFLAIISLWSKKTYHCKFFIALAGLLLVLATNNPISQLVYHYPIPLLSTGTPTRNLFIYIFCVSILAGAGFDSLKARVSIKKPFLLFGFLMSGIFALYIVKPTLLYPFTEITTITAMKKSFAIALVLTIGTVLSIIVGKKIPFVRSGIIFLASIELFWGFTKFNTFIPRAYVFPPNEIFEFLQKNAGINRFWGYGTARIEANFATQYGVYSPDGTDPLNLHWYNRFLQSSIDGNVAQTFNRTTRSDAQLTPGYGINDLPENIYRLRIMDMLGVRYILDRSENPKDENTFSADRFKEILHQNNWIIYENIHAAPRYMLTDKVTYYATDKEFEDVFFDPSFDPRTTIALPSKYRNLDTKGEIRSQKVELLRYKPNEITFHVTTNKPQFLFISDTFDYGWKSFLDNTRVDTLLANYAFRAVYVPTGTHNVTMKYLPDEFIQGAVLSILGVILLCYIGITKRLRV